MLHTVSIVTSEPSLSQGIGLLHLSLLSSSSSLIMVALNMTLAAIAAGGASVQLISSRGTALSIPFSRTGNLSPILTDSSNNRATNQLVSRLQTLLQCPLLLFSARLI